MLEEMKAQALPEGANAQLIGQVFGQIGGFKERHCNPTKDHCEYINFCFRKHRQAEQEGKAKGFEVQWQIDGQPGDETR